MKASTLNRSWKLAYSGRRDPRRSVVRAAIEEAEEMGSIATATEDVTAGRHARQPVPGSER